MTDNIVELLNSKARYTDRAFNNGSLGDLYREAAAHIEALTAERDAMREALNKAASGLEIMGQSLAEEGMSAAAQHPLNWAAIARQALEQTND